MILQRLLSIQKNKRDYAAIFFVARLHNVLAQKQRSSNHCQLFLLLQIELILNIPETHLFHPSCYRDDPFEHESVWYRPTMRAYRFRTGVRSPRRARSDSMMPRLLLLLVQNSKRGRHDLLEKAPKNRRCLRRVFRTVVSFAREPRWLFPLLGERKRTTRTTSATTARNPVTQSKKNNASRNHERC